MAACFLDRDRDAANVGDVRPDVIGELRESSDCAAGMSGSARRRATNVVEQRLELVQQRFADLGEPLQTRRDIGSSPRDGRAASRTAPLDRRAATT